jgi:hypothetical protein
MWVRPLSVLLLSPKSIKGPRYREVGIWYAVRLADRYASSARTRVAGSVTLSFLATAADGCAWRSAFGRRAMAELLDLKDGEAY